MHPLVIIFLCLLASFLVIRRAVGWAYSEGWNDALESLRKKTSEPEEE